MSTRTSRGSEYSRGRSDFLGKSYCQKPNSGPVGRKEISGCQHHDFWLMRLVDQSFVPQSTNQGAY